MQDLHLGQKVTVLEPASYSNFQATFIKVAEVVSYVKNGSSITEVTVRNLSPYGNSGLHTVTASQVVDLGSQGKLWDNDLA